MRPPKALHVPRNGADELSTPSTECKFIRLKQFRQLGAISGRALDYRSRPALRAHVQAPTVHFHSPQFRSYSSSSHLLECETGAVGMRLAARAKIIIQHQQCRDAQPKYQRSERSGQGVVQGLGFNV